MRFPPDLAKISLDSVISPQIQHKSHKNLKYFDQKLIGKFLLLPGKFLLRKIMVRFRSGRLKRVLEERTRQPTPWSQFLGFVTRHQPARALRSITGGSNMIGWIKSGSGSRWTPLKRSLPLTHALI